MFNENINSDALISFDAICVVIIMLQKSKTNKYKEKLVILSLIRDHSRETREVTYTYRYTSGHYSLIQSSYIVPMTELGCPLVYWHV